MNKGCILFIFLSVNLFGARLSFAQDERFFRDVLTGKNKKDETLDGSLKKSEVEAKWKAKGPKYQYDLNGDGKKEIIQVIKRDTHDFFKITNSKGKLIYRGELDAKGVDSNLFKISLKALDKKRNLLIFHYYEGYTKYLNFNGQGRLYFLSFEKENFRKINFSKGPIFWTEVENNNNHYYYRNYDLQVLDLNKDGRNEIILKFADISRVWFFSESQGWKTYH